MRRLRQFSTLEFASAVREIADKEPFDVDETLPTWQASYFRFVRASRHRFSSLVSFAAMAIFTTQQPIRPVEEWAETVTIFPIDESRLLDTLEAARDDCVDSESDQECIPDWLAFDGDVIGGFDLIDRNGPLCDIATHHVFQTTASYFYICINRES